MNLRALGTNIVHSAQFYFTGKHRMQNADGHQRILETYLARIRSLEKENQELRHEVRQLRLEKLVEKTQVPEEKLKAVVFRPQPPPRPAATIAAIPPAPSFKEVNGKHKPLAAAPAPPPPPLPSKVLAGSSAVRRVPEVIELYRLLTRKTTCLERKPGSLGVQPVKFSQNMIGEIENRSVYLTAIKSDVETQGEFIDMVAREVTNAAHTQISQVEAFVKWLDEQMSYLVDERAVLKHFKQWPERKADALREAAFSYRDLKNLEVEASSFKDNPNESLTPALKRMQALQERLEQSVNNTERLRESASKRYRDLRIPWEWMLDTGVIGQLKLSSIRLSGEYMRRIAKAVTSSENINRGDLVLQGVRFAYRVHQFAGGFDAYTTEAFEELKKIVTSSS